jgi:hypothetical protein
VQALRVLATELKELDRIRIGVSAFGHHFHAEVVCERYDRTQDHGACSLAVGAHEGLIDLDEIERKPLQIGKRGMAAAEVVKCQPGAKIADALQHLRRVLGILHYQRFRELQFERAARKARPRDDRAYVVDQVLPQQLTR